MTTKRTHGPCTCGWTPVLTRGHSPDCPSLYPAQHEPDALTKLVRLIRMGPESGSIAHRDVFAVKALDLISEAREEQRKARSEGLEEAAKVADQFNQSARSHRASMQTSVMRAAWDEAANMASDVAVSIREKKGP